jgi:hypothetical protein
MGSYRVLILSLTIVSVSGCSAVVGQHKTGIDKEDYRQEVRKQLQEVIGQFQGGDFPYYHWASPIVQEVEIPAHLTNGVMIPQHKELVIIKPGEWMMNQGYPIQSQQRKSDDQKFSNNSARDISNLTVLPQVVGKSK